MQWFKRNPVFCTILFLLGAVLLVQAGWWWMQRSEAIETRETYEQKRQEYERLRTHNPSLTPENIELARLDLESVSENLDVIRGTLGAEADVSGIFENPPTSTTEAYFDISTFVGEYRARANQAGVGLRENEYFGFSRYRQTGPPPELIEPVYKQRQVIAYLLDVLFQSRPFELVRVSREDIAGQMGMEDVPSPLREDLFEMDPRISAEIPDLVDTMAFRVEFTGYTQTLREFLNYLAQPEMPLLARSVEVEPADAEALRRTGMGMRMGGDGGGGGGGGRFDFDTGFGGPGAGQAQMPIIAAEPSRFVVTVEFVELAIASE